MINTNLKFWRRELALTQAQMAEKLGIKRSLVGAYEEGRAEPRLATLVNMARLFGITLDQLVTTDFSKKKNTKVIGSLPRPTPTRPAETDDQPEPPTPAGASCASWPSPWTRTRTRTSSWCPRKPPPATSTATPTPSTWRCCPSSACPCSRRRALTAPSKLPATPCCPLPAAPSSWAATWKSGPASRTARPASW